MKRRDFLSLALLPIISITCLKRKTGVHHIDSTRLYVPEEYNGGSNWEYKDEYIKLVDGNFNNCKFINCHISGNAKRLINCQFYDCFGDLDVTGGIVSRCLFDHCTSTHKS